MRFCTKLFLLILLSLCFDNGDDIICSCLLNEYFKGQNVHLQLMFPFKIGCSVTGFLLLIRVHRPLVVQ